MLHLKRKKFFLPINEYYFYDEKVDEVIDAGILNIFVQSKVQGNGFRSRITQTLLIDLRQDEEEIFAQIKKGYRYDIRQSGKDNIDLILNRSPSLKDIDDFFGFYNSFAEGIGIGSANRSKLIAAMRVGALILSEARTLAGKTLVSHALIHDHGRIRLLYSGSLYRETSKETRALIGRCNKSLHWQEIKEAKNMKFSFYDFGGISIDGSTSNIDKFKSSFGGVLIEEYNSLKIGVLA